MIELVIFHLRRVRFNLQDEKQCQMQIADQLNLHGIKFEREYRLDDENIPDFMVGDIAIEVKIKGNAKKIYKQLERYAQFKEVNRILLITNRSMGLPPFINHKSTYVLNMGRAWL